MPTKVHVFHPPRSLTRPEGGLASKGQWPWCRGGWYSWGYHQQHSWPVHGVGRQVSSVDKRHRRMVNQSIHVWQPIKNPF